MGDPLHLIEGGSQPQMRKQFAAMEKKGRAFILIERLGCVVSLFAGLLSFLAFMFGFPWVGGTFAAITMGAYLISTVVDPEFANDRRAQIVDAMLVVLGEGEVRMDLQLRPPEAFAPQSKKTADHRGLILRYEQQWLTLDHKNDAGRHVEITVDVCAEEHQTGIEVRSSEVTETLTLRTKPVPENAQKFVFSHEDLKSVTSEVIQDKHRVIFVSKDLIFDDVAVEVVRACFTPIE